jgi:phage terminase large subunit GpA-like protein
VSGAYHEFSDFLSKTGTLSFFITVDLYKDRWAAALRKHWHGEGAQPEVFFNAPQNLLDKELKELTVEYKVVVTDERTGKAKGHLWKRPDKADNELWDLLMYANGAHDMLAKEYCDSIALDRVDFELFWTMCEDAQPPPYFYTVKR